MVPYKKTEHKLRDTINQNFQLSNSGAPKLLKQVHIRKLVTDVASLFSESIDLQQIQLEIDIPFRSTATLDPVMVQRAIANLMLNAIEAMPEGGELLVTSYLNHQQLELEIADSGPGVSDSVKLAVRQNLTWGSRSSETGLSQVQSIANAHGGSISAVNCSTGGAAFTLTIPQQRHVVRAAA